MKRWASLTSRSFRTSITRPCRKTPWLTQKDGPPACRCRRTRLTTRPPSKWSTKQSALSPKAIGNCLRRNRKGENINGQTTRVPQVLTLGGMVSQSADHSRPDRTDVRPSRGHSRVSFAKIGDEADNLVDQCPSQDSESSHRLAQQWLEGIGI